MSLGMGIAVAGIWIGAGIMTIALTLGNALAGVDAGDTSTVLMAPAGAAAGATFFVAIFS